MRIFNINGRYLVISPSMAVAIQSWTSDHRRSRECHVLTCDEVGPLYADYSQRTDAT